MQVHLTAPKPSNKRAVQGRGNSMMSLELDEEEARDCDGSLQRRWEMAGELYRCTVCTRKDVSPAERVGGCQGVGHLKGFFASQLADQSSLQASFRTFRSLADKVSRAPRPAAGKLRRKHVHTYIHIYTLLPQGPLKTGGEQCTGYLRQRHSWKFLQGALGCKMPTVESLDVQSAPFLCALDQFFLLCPVSSTGGFGPSYSNENFLFFRIVPRRQG